MMSHTRFHPKASSFKILTSKTTKAVSVPLTPPTETPLPPCLPPSQSQSLQGETIFFPFATVHTHPLLPPRAIYTFLFHSFTPSHSASGTKQY